MVQYLHRISWLFWTIVPSNSEERKEMNQTIKRRIMASRGFSDTIHISYRRLQLTISYSDFFFFFFNPQRVCVSVYHGLFLGCIFFCFSNESPDCSRSNSFHPVYKRPIDVICAPAEVEGRDV